MTEREMVAKRLEYCVENKCDICQKENGSGFPWIDGRCYGFTERLYDAIALLRAQEPHVSHKATQNYRAETQKATAQNVEVKQMIDEINRRTRIPFHPDI